MGKRWVSQKITQAAQQISTVNWSSIRKSTRWASAQVWSACTFYTIQMKETNSISQNSTCRPCSQLFRELHFNIHSRFFLHFCLYRLSPTMIVIQLFNRYLYHIIVDTYIYIYVISPNYHIYIHFSTVIMPCSASFFSSALRRRHVGAAGSISAAVAVASPMHCLGVAKKAQRLGGLFWCVPLGQRWISDENLGWEWWLPSGKLTVGPWK